MIREGPLPLNVERLERMSRAVQGESERGSVLINATILDELLRQSIESHLVQHPDVKKFTQGFNAPIGSFHSRILLSFAIGLIPEDQYKQLELMRKIRNVFAHNVDASFKLQSVLSHCDLLSQSPVFAAMPNAIPQEVFLISAALLMVVIESRLPEASRQRLFYGELTTKAGAPPEPAI